MRQTTLFGLPAPATTTVTSASRRTTASPTAASKETTTTTAAAARINPLLAISDGTQSLVDFLRTEEELLFHAVLPLGNTLKCIAELLLRCAPQSPMTVDPENGLCFSACDPGSGRLIHIRIHPDDMIQFRVYSAAKTPFRCSLETGSLFASFHRGGGTVEEGGKAVRLSLFFLSPASFPASLLRLVE